jgi:hypothetical protein
MFKSSFLTALLTLAAAQVCGAADNRAVRVPVLLELFTSEGCSSCPPADALLMRLDQTQPVNGAQIIVLSEHVDYWNHLGWSDPFSSPQFSARQEAYGRALRVDAYTPQLVIDGSEQFVGSDAGPIQAAIARAASRPKLTIKIVSAQREGSEAVVTVSAPVGQGDIWIAVADERDESSVKRGENQGRTLPHVAVVRHLVPAGSLRPGQAFEKQIRLPLSPGTQPGGTRIVAFIASHGGPIVGASMTPLKP